MATRGNMSEEYKIECLARYLLEGLRTGRKSRRDVELKFTQSKKRPEAFKEKLRAEMNRQIKKGGK